MKNPAWSMAKLASCCVAASIGLDATVGLGQENSEVKINPGHNGVWFNPETSGQGFLLDVLPETNIAFLSWFTYDTTLPGQDETAQVGDPGHRWLTAQGPLDGNTANLDVYIASSGLFDDPAPVSRTPDGSITLTFQDCISGTVDYQLTSAGISGSIPIKRVANDNVALCESIGGTQNLKLRNIQKANYKEAASSNPIPTGKTTAVAQNCKINPGHNGVWFNPETSGQGFLLDVLPETNIAFLSWFTYDTTLPGQDETAQVGDPGHRWLTAQGPLDGNAANLTVYVTSGGLFDDPAPVNRTPDGSITLTFQDCSSGTVDYQLTSAGLSGSIPISRAADDNVALCASLCGEVVVEESQKRSAVYGVPGGVLDVVDSQSNISRLTIPEGGLVGTQDQRIEVFPLAQQTTLPTGHSAIAGLQWSSEPGAVIRPAKLEVFTVEVERYQEIAAFYFGPQGEAFYFLPLHLEVDVGAVLEVPFVYPGATGLAYVTADEMEKWSPPGNPPEAKYLQQMAVAVKRAIESASVKQAAPGNTPMAEQSSYLETFLPVIKEWFDNEVQPILHSAIGGCDIAVDFITTGFMWLDSVQQYGLEDHQELQSRISALESAIDILGTAANQDISDMDGECALEPDPCKQMKIMQEGLVCSQALQSIGAESSGADLACSNAPAMLEVTPSNSNQCPQETINFNAIVTNMKGEALPIDQVNLNWSSLSTHLLTIDQESGKAKALAEGIAWVEASSEVCEEVLNGSAFVKIDGVPDIAGNYSLVGSETAWGCYFPEDNGTYGGRAQATIALGNHDEQSGSTDFSGTSSGPGFGDQFNGTVSCGGVLSGSGTYTETEPCDEGTCTTTGNSTFIGLFLDTTIMVDFIGQDLSGDTCSSRGWAKATRSN